MFHKQVHFADKGRHPCVLLSETINCLIKCNDVTTASHVCRKQAQKHTVVELCDTPSHKGKAKGKQNKTKHTGLQMPDLKNMKMHNISEKKDLYNSLPVPYRET